MVKDPVCNMNVEIESAKFTSELNGKTYYFCAAGCKEEFDRNPENFIGKSMHDHSGNHGCCH